MSQGHTKTYKIRCPQPKFRSQSNQSLHLLWIIKNPTLLQSESKASDQTAQMFQLIGVLAGGTHDCVGFGDEELSSDTIIRATGSFKRNFHVKIQRVILLGNTE